ncbi:hypothetical protein ACFL48_04705, partial [Pseudomonadota bacterium]
MHKQLFKLPLALLLLMALVTSGNAAATDETIQTLRLKLEAFNSSSEHQFAPSAAAKAAAYLGAAMMADESGEAEKATEGLAKALIALNEARANAKQFQKQYGDLLRYKNAAEQALSQVDNEASLQQPNPNQLLQGAETSLHRAIGLFEDGDLSSSQQGVDEAKQKYIEVINAALPLLIDKTGSTLSKASAAGAKKAAPKSYEAAKLELSKMERYADGVSQLFPTEPGYALTLARRSLHIAQQ